MVGAFRVLAASCQEPASRPPRPILEMARETAARRLFPLRVRHAVLTAHITMSVGLLGDSAGFLAVSVRAARAEDPAAVVELIRVLGMFAVVFGIPLSFGALLSGLALGLGTRWGVFRYPWVVTKLALIVSVMAVGALVINPALAATLEGGDGTPRLIAAAAYDVLALSVATTLSVFKPGGPFRRPAIEMPREIRRREA
jgi:hypothetical protein